MALRATVAPFVDLSELVMYGHNYTTRRVAIPANVQLGRGEAVELDGTAPANTVKGDSVINQVKALGGDATKLYGYMLHDYSSMDGVACEGDVIFASPRGIAKELIYWEGKTYDDFAELELNGRLPLVDNIEYQAVKPADKGVN
jgi:hypothetical protein